MWLQVICTISVVCIILATFVPYSILRPKFTHPFATLFIAISHIRSSFWQIFSSPGWVPYVKVRFVHYCGRYYHPFSGNNYIYSCVDAGLMRFAKSFTSHGDESMTTHKMDHTVLNEISFINNDLIRLPDNKWVRVDELWLQCTYRKIMPSTDLAATVSTNIRADDATIQRAIRGLREWSVHVSKKNDSRININYFGLYHYLGTHWSYFSRQNDNKLSSHIVTKITHIANSVHRTSMYWGITPVVRIIMRDHEISSKCDHSELKYNALNRMAIIKELIRGIAQQTECKQVQYVSPIGIETMIEHDKRHDYDTIIRKRLSELMYSKINIFDHFSVEQYADICRPPSLSREKMMAMIISTIKFIIDYSEPVTVLIVDDGETPLLKIPGITYVI